ncbi:MAG TPA: histidine triad nucleotide-binding protein [Flexilinea sp.]|jgi:histidine triad (HIT) family protein|nr:histidine triad nucleotide-binding protein [Flexilinea sp.]HNY18897.1 histidine triad nucleotide-binding protein [Flexilinea sp.]HPS48028.1 histidine triad nucleotide-binding protein [Flexilinea sp.]HQN63362.1 histidine triad nucleotide-binding protein [Flexilinea sp.]HRY20354.1 histidine triad nucleotide-binding protein [Flexilinea sp.]
MRNFDSDCIFCKIAKGEISSEIVYRDEFVTAFKDLSPVAPVHILMVPNGHYLDLNDCAESDKELLGYILLVGAKIAKQLGIDQSGYRIIVNDGPDAGQTVFHLHFHLLGGRPLAFKNQ